MASLREDRFQEKFPENLKMLPRGSLVTSGLLGEAVGEESGAEQLDDAVSVDEERVLDPRGVLLMEGRWQELLEDVLGRRMEDARNSLEGEHGTDPREGKPREVGDHAERPQSEDGSTTTPRTTPERRQRAEVFWTRSRYEGLWDADLDIPWGKGLYRLPYGAEYAGEMRDGVLEGNGAMRYPDGSWVLGEWRSGRLLQETARVEFRDGLSLEGELQEWSYCRAPQDRRFHVERLYGLRGAGRSHLTQGYPTRDIPAGCYDTGDGFYDPATRCVLGPDTGKVLRIPTDKEAEHIKKTYRKAWDENVDYLPDAFDGVTDVDDVESLIPIPIPSVDAEIGDQEARRESIPPAREPRRGTEGGRNSRLEEQ